MKSDQRHPFFECLYRSLLTFSLMHIYCLQEVKVYVAACALHGLRLHVPETPFSDDQLDTIFHLLISLFRQLGDRSSAHFDLILSLLQHAARLKCFVISLDLENASALQLELVTTLMEVINVDNAELIELPALEVMSTAIDEADDVSQPLLDAMLSRLLVDSNGDENPAAHHLARRLITRCQDVVQPYIQKFITRVLDGQQTDSELVDKTSDLILALYQSVPQVMLPVLPHLSPSLQVVDVDRRLEAVDLVASILAQSGAAQLLHDVPALPEALLRRLEDQDRKVRLRVLTHAKSLVDAASDDIHRHRVASAAAHRLKDFDEGVRIQAASTVCSIAADHPQSVRSPEYELLLSRLRDRRVNVRKNVAKDVAKLVKTWCLRWEDASGPAAHRGLVIDMALGLCTLAASNDVELAFSILDDAFKFGVFPARLPPASLARWWAQAWASGSPTQRGALTALLRGKCELQRQVQEALNLRERLKSSAKKGQSHLDLRSSGSQTKEERSQAESSGKADDAATPADVERNLQQRLESLSTALRDVPRAEEGLNRLWNSKDNNVFRALATLASYGTSFADAGQAGKDLMQSMGSRGAAAEVARALASRLAPNLLSPETLEAALLLCIDCEESHALVLDMSRTAPQLFARCMSPLVNLLGMDDIFASETAARILFNAGEYMRQSMGAGMNEANDTNAMDFLPTSALEQLRRLCLQGSIGGGKNAIGAITKLTSDGTAELVLRELGTELLESLSEDRVLQSHPKIIAILKSLSMIGRLSPLVFADFVEDLHVAIMQDLLSSDLSSGEPLHIYHSLHTSTSSISPSEEEGIRDIGVTWGCPSPDVAVKAAAIKAFAQSLVPEDPQARLPQATRAVASAFIAQIGDLTDVDTAASQFECFHWRLASVIWQHRTSVNAESQSNESIKDDPATNNKPEYYWEDYSPEERSMVEKQAQDRSPDAGWIRLAAATSLLRLSRAYDGAGGNMTGNDYITLGLSCQDCIPEVRRALIQKIWATTEYFSRVLPNPQRAAKAAALYALYGADIVDQENVRLAFEHLHKWAAMRRDMVDHSVQTAVGSGASGTLINEMPEFILPFLIFFVAHHPDYDSVTLFGDDARDAPLALFLRILQFALEVLIPPPPPGGNAPEAAAETARQSAATLKILRQLKFCDVLGLEGGPEADEAATYAAHQVCDMALMLAKQLTQRALVGHQLRVGKFPGALTLPKLCFKPRKNLSSSSKRADGSDLPAGYDRPHLSEPLFTSTYLMKSMQASKEKVRRKLQNKVGGPGDGTKRDPVSQGDDNKRLNAASNKSQPQKMRSQNPSESMNVLATKGEKETLLSQEPDRSFMAALPREKIIPQVLHEAADPGSDGSNHDLLEESDGRGKMPNQVEWPHPTTELPLNTAQQQEEQRSSEGGKEREWLSEDLIPISLRGSPSDNQENQDHLNKPKRSQKRAAAASAQTERKAVRASKRLRG